MPNKPIRILPHLDHHLPYLHAGLMALHDSILLDRAFAALDTISSDQFVQRRIEIADETEVLLNALASLYEEPVYRMMGAAQLAAATDPTSPYASPSERKKYAEAEDEFAAAVLGATEF